MTTYKDIVYDAQFPEICKLDLYLPENAAKMPVYMYIHGGGIESGSKSDASEMAKKLTENGVALASIDYHMYSAGRFPDYLNDAAAAAKWLLRKGSKYAEFSGLVIGGSSAGGYISMMLYFNPAYLANKGVALTEIRGWFFDAGQPTTHFNVLKYEHGLDSRCVIIDEGAPLYYLRNAYTAETYNPKIFICCSEHDMVNRLEQLQMLHAAMLHFGFPKERLQMKVYDCKSHCGYLIWDEYFADTVNFVKNCLE
ncbi:MAG: alpha/beta hydrolase [Clostridiales bacterium]|nr:alpha/beta hydrolase [Clostridiales bacterium]